MKPRTTFLLALLLGWVAWAGPFLSAGPVPAQSSGVAVDSHESLFTVLCALYAAGFEQELALTGVHPARARMRAEMSVLRGPEVEAIRAFYRQHRLADSAAMLSRFVSYGLLLGPPPKFALLLPREQLPPEVLALEGFHELLPDFYRAANIRRHWESVQPQYEREIERLREPLGQIVLVATSYLRELLRPSPTRSFTVYVEPLIGPRTSLRNFGDRYALVTSPAVIVPAEEMRHAFLHYLLDPLPLRYRDAVERLQPLHHHAGRSALLPVEYRTDFSALLTECLVRAVELRLQGLKEAALAAAFSHAEQEGYVLVPALHRALGAFQAAEPALGLYFPDMLATINVNAEMRRLQNVQFSLGEVSGVSDGRVADPPGAGQAAPHSGSHPAEDELSRLLREAERHLAGQDADAATPLFEQALTLSPGHPRALYGLAIAATLDGEIELAKERFRRLIGQSLGGARGAGGDARIRAWSHIYLGRIYDQEGSRDLAVSEYRAALAVEGAPEAARQAAQQGLEKGYGPTPRRREPG